MSETQQGGTPIKKGNNVHLRMQSATVRKLSPDAQISSAECSFTSNDNDDSKLPQHKRKRTTSRITTNPFSWCRSIQLILRQFKMKTGDRPRKTIGGTLLIALCACIALEQFLGRLSGRTNEVVLLSSPKPRIMGLYKTSSGESVTFAFDPITIPTTRAKQRIRRQATDWYWRPDSDENAKGHRADPFEEGDCKAMYQWQKQSFPSCNLIHEHQVTADDVATNTMNNINHGFFRDVWRVRKDFNEANPANYSTVVLKTLRMEQPFDDYNADRHRRDAVAMERLTSSPHVVNIYGHCVNSQLTEYSDGGDVYDAVFNEKLRSSITKVDRLRIAIHIATGVAEVHNLEREGRAPMAHTDITPTQFILIGGVYKLNDFNRVRFIRWNEKTNEPCPYTVANNPGEFRSPEEYEYGNQTEKVDIYSMGNVFYVLLTSKWPWEGVKEEEAQRLVIEGKRPVVDESIKTSDDAVDKALLKAMEMCFVHDPSQRASASEVLDFLASEMATLNASVQ